MNITWREAHEAAMYFAEYSLACVKQSRKDVPQAEEWMRRSHEAWGQFKVYSGLSDQAWTAEGNHHVTIGGSKR